MSDRDPVRAAGAMHGIVVVDDAGIVRFIDDAACRILHRDRATSCGRPCGEVLALRSASSEEDFCSESCPALQVCCAENNATRSFHVRADGTEHGLHLDLFTVPLARLTERRPAIMHVLVPRGQAPLEAAVRSDALDEERPRPAQVLSAREQEVIGLLSEGYSTAEIADALYISPATVKNHVKHILGKLGVHRQIDAVLAWLRDPDRPSPP